MSSTKNRNIKAASHMATTADDESSSVGQPGSSVDARLLVSLARCRPLSSHMYYAYSELHKWHFWQDDRIPPEEGSKPSLIPPFHRVPYCQSAGFKGDYIRPTFRNAATFRYEPVMSDATRYITQAGNAILTEDESALSEKLKQYENLYKLHSTGQELQSARNELRDGIVRIWAAVLGRRLCRSIEHDSIEQQKELVELLSETAPLPPNSTRRTWNTIGRPSSDCRR